MNVREHFIGLMLEKIREIGLEQPLNIIEIGTMFQTVEGRSTYRIAKFIKEHDLDARFVSIDLDQEHIESARSLIKGYDESLLDLVEFRRGFGSEILGSVLPEMKQVHFALIDGGAQPEYCMNEFEMIKVCLSVDGACLIDDLGELSPTQPYPGKRPFGKGTLIYPALILADYLKYKEGKTIDSIHESSIIGTLDKQVFLSLLDDADFCRIGPAGGGHAMLAYGNPLIIENIRQAAGERWGKKRATKLPESKSELNVLGRVRQLLSVVRKRTFSKEDAQ